ncbi:transcription factor JunD [Vanessa tameamea]|uniref:Transcription factor JunD n=1 Tax=Vanessa tameamea TaxID=334116 RepID=A0A8B8IHB2_VANTA|nr:transcription factor jun-D [Vanessa tameamea]XP_046969935.1 transcription factor JunD [Vanessa cardui]XP_047536068.1 transcription factor JunD [Vanessa atalanta]
MVRQSGHGMETTFYDEQYPLSGPVDNLKRSLTLDLDFGRGGKRARGGAPVLSSPDLQLLKLGSPELEKLIMQNGMITTATPTPGGQVMFPPAMPTEEQEMYARPFVEALDKLHHSEPAPHGRRVYADLDRPLDRYPTPVVKDEPQTVPSASSSPPLSPIDMDTQERIKLERKRQRNRVAASKCRRRKLERISKLEEKVKLLKGENADLAQMVVKLKDHVSRLKQQVLEHANGGCHIDTHF